MKIHQLLLFFLVTIICSSCDWFGNPPSFEDDFVTYKLSAGSHDADNTQGSLKFAKNNKIEFQAIFDETAKYKTRIPGNVHDINKLMGFSDCGGIHHQNSARFGWNWMDEQLKIYAYVYVNGSRIAEKVLGSIELNKTHHFKLEARNNQYIFTLNGKEETMDRGCSGNLNMAYMLFPYFGGDETAPQDIFIKIRML